MHCGKPFESAHKRRLYCGNSCSTLAYYARRRPPASHPLSADIPALAAPEADSPPAPTPLGADLRTVGVVAAGTMVGTYGVRLLDKLFDTSSTPPTLPVPPLPLPAQREDPAGWFPAAVLAQPALMLPVQYPEWTQPHVCLQLNYFGRRFYYQPALRCLFWECAPGQLWLLNWQAEFTHVFELDIPQLAPPLLGYAAPRLPNAND
ncbi:hypothetical protein [Hymenobacter cheonanensis]|uniref:hypothetical protein n=1 Tax=Hymenobacter sp. CA2-7 TaxID=3063993 RepID=UPI002712E55C|nr:hypothetical protein [Hymenobacter sp. CA2-7]MDO7888141.1 hypothetical protein [Hymenobacter sp. CA2-7]